MGLIIVKTQDIVKSFLNLIRRNLIFLPYPVDKKIEQSIIIQVGGEYFELFHDAIIGQIYKNYGNADEVAAEEIK
ncbi:hypothetical protein [Sporofaciens musculi]|uniref:hypothetical protein n=1 Tax=Sporofaciens musculi TaxID=2681861 RepID=UPI00259C86B9|nr:hypothetical protein [Sporofaciens musculi]